MFVKWGADNEIDAKQIAPFLGVSNTTSIMDRTERQTYSLVDISVPPTALGAKLQTTFRFAQHRAD